MIDPRTLRGRLGLGYALALLAALSGFALVALILVDRTQRSALDEQLGAAAQALTTIPDERAGRIVLDRDDVEQFRRVTAGGIAGAIVDARGIVLTAAATPLPPQLRLDARYGAALRTVGVPSGALRVAVAPIVHDGRLRGSAVAWRELNRIDDLDRRLALAFGAAIPLIVVVAATLGGIVVARGLRPLTALAALASEIEAHDLSARIAAGGNDELARLCATFDKMLDRLEDAFERQRRFAGDASHEIRAPLAVIRAEADLMLRKQRTPEEYERALRAIAAHADELEALVRDLLAAARGDVSSDDAPVDLRGVVDAALERFALVPRDRAIAFARRSAPAWSRGDPAALRRAVQCIVHNAVTFSPRGGTISVGVERAAGEARIVVADEGPGFSADALLHATERFWRDEHVRTARDEGDVAGSGLGLSIAEAIAASAGGVVRLANAPEGGAVVTLAFPDRTPSNVK